MQTINHKLVEIALERIDGTAFENFFQAFYCALIGTEFVPLGGMRDGGADAFYGQGLFESRPVKPGIFYQATIQEDHQAKIGHTVRRLREVGRDPKMLHYFTSRTIQNIDRQEEDLSVAHGLTVRIRDRKWIVGNINNSPQTVAAFNTYMAPYTAFLSDVGSATVINTSSNLPVRAACVFLGQEIDRRRGNTDLLEAVTDSLILWALEGTDPDAGKFMTRNEVRTKIEEVLPSAIQFIRSVFDQRIKLLSSKGNPTGREIRWYRQADKFCLPYETREIVKAENTEDEFLKLQIVDLYRRRATDWLQDEDGSLPDTVARVAHRALELTFEKDGLDLVAFLSETRHDHSPVAISDQVDEAIQEETLTADTGMTVKEAAISVIRQAFYHSTEEERVYYGKLSRTYTLMFTLRNEPQIVEYFKGMSSHFVLLVGSDLIVRALSERFLAPEDQMTVNLFRILREAGSTLLLTKMVVEEVQAHLAGTDHEFQNWFAALEPHVDAEVARHASKILIRAYFYARQDPLLENRPTNWRSYVGQVCSYADLHFAEKSRKQVKDYLMEKFGFEYLDAEDLGELANEDEIRELADKLKEIKSDDILALNDARQILAVYGKRRELREDHKPNPYGYRTWWLTHETRVRRVTGDLVKARGAQYIMRPEFILNFVALSPTTEQVRRSYNTVFPSLLGVRLSNRMREDIFHDTLRRIREISEVDEARAKALMAEMSDKLKGDKFKTYENTFSNGNPFC